MGNEQQIGDMRQVEFTERTRVKSETYEPGDRKSFPRDQADRYIARGWAKCVETGEQGERQPGSVRVQPQSVAQQSS